MKGTVIKDWVTECCTWKQQTVLLSALRGCDGIAKENPSKDVSRLLRFTLIKDADSSSGYMTNEQCKSKVDLDKFFNYLDALPVHYVFHLAHAAAIVGYLHPESPDGYAGWNPQKYWLDFYLRLCRSLHVNHENLRQLNARLADGDVPHPDDRRPCINR